MKERFIYHLYHNYIISRGVTVPDKDRPFCPYLFAFLIDLWGFNGAFGLVASEDVVIFGATGGFCVLLSLIPIKKS